MSKFYGCGAPLPLGIDGLHVLDLGSGSGRDCYVCSALVGPSGSVVGVDMTDEQNAVRKHLLVCCLCCRAHCVLQGLGVAPACLLLPARHAWLGMPRAACWTCLAGHAA